MTGKALLLLALTASTVLVGVDQACAQSPAASIEQRQAAMRASGAAMKAVVPLARGDAAWNAAAPVPALESLLASARNTPAMFPAGSGPESGLKTRALATIWTRRAEFEASAKSLADAAEAMLAAARANDEAGFKRGFAALSRPCASCHETFRASQ